MSRTEGQRLPVAYWRLWWAAGIDSVGDGAFSAAVPLLAVTVTRDPRLISLVAAATYVPWLLLSFPAGALVDRRDRVGLMWRAQAMQGAIVALLAVLVAFGWVSIAVLVVAALGLGAGEVVFGNAALAMLPDLVSKPLLHKANGNQQTIVTLGMQFVGPPVGSLLFSVAAALPFGLDAVSFAGSSVLLAGLPRADRPTDGHPPMWQAIMEGLRWLLHHRLLRTMAIVLGVNTFAFQLAYSTLVLLVTQTLHLTAGAYGVLLGAAAIGSVLGGLVNARVVGWLGTRRSLIVVLIANSVLFLAIGWSPNVIVLGALLAGLGFATTLWNNASVSLRQHIVPSALLGRVNSVYRMLGWGLMPLGAVAGGLVAHTFGLRAPFPVAGVLRGIVFLAALPVLASVEID